MRSHVLALTALLALGAISTAHAANSCDDPIVDEAHVISDVGKVSTAARALSAVGADVRVRTLSSFHGASDLDTYERDLVRSCPSWQAAGHLRSSMLVMLFEPNALKAGIYYGIQHQEKLNPVWKNIQASALKPAIKEFRSGEKDAYTRAYVSMLGDFRTALGTTPATRADTVTIINKEAGDGSWFGEMVIALALIAVAAGAGLYFLRRKDDRGDRLAVAAETANLRAACRNRLLSLDNDRMVIEARVGKASGRADAAELAQLLASYKTCTADGMRAFSEFDDPSRSASSASNLPAEALLSNQRRYADITIQYVEKAEAARDEISRRLTQAAAA